MRNDEELYPCRFCGENPIVTAYTVLCGNCQHAIPLPAFSNDVKKFWQARNEKHNPFRKENNNE